MCRTFSRTFTPVRSPYLLGWGAVAGHGISTSFHNRSPGALPRPATLVSGAHFALRQLTSACGPVLPVRAGPSLALRLVHSVSSRSSWFGWAVGDEHPVEVTIAQRDGGVNPTCRGS